MRSVRKKNPDIWRRGKKRSKCTPVSKGRKVIVDLKKIGVLL